MKTLQQVEPRTPIESLPFTITASGSYYLTKNLQFTATSGNAINVKTSDVTIDLQGFTLSSTAAVTGDAVAIASNLGDICVANGAIAGTTTVSISGTKPSRIWTPTLGGFNNGIVTTAASGKSSQFSRLRMSGCRSSGIDSDGHDLIREVTASMNGEKGILAPSGTLVGCLGFQNGTGGLQAESITNGVASSNGGYEINGFRLSHCESSDNSAGYIGVDLSNTSAASNCLALRNDPVGFYRVGKISDCTSSDNAEGFAEPILVRDSASKSNGGMGISSGATAAIENSRVNSNGGLGISLGLRLRVSGCV